MFLCGRDSETRIPSHLGRLTILKELVLIGCFVGEIPTEIFGLTMLTALCINFANSPGGSIPASPGDLSYLKYWYFGYNGKKRLVDFWSCNRKAVLFKLTLARILRNTLDLSGSLPTEIGLLSAATEVYLGSNSLTGTLPTEVGLMTSLYYFGVSRNLITGTIPSELGLISGSFSLWLYDLDLTGTVPQELCDLSGLSLRITCGTISCPYDCSNCVCA